MAHACVDAVKDAGLPDEHCCMALARQAECPYAEGAKKLMEAIPSSPRRKLQ